MNDEPALKPCPLCGDAEVSRSKFVALFAQCTKCGCMAPMETWNTRDATPPKPRRITQLCPDATGDLLALCNDGTVLRLAAYGQRWVRYGGEVPQD